MSLVQQDILNRNHSRTAIYQPLLLVACFFALGVIVDHNLAISWFWLLPTFIVAMSVWTLAYRYNRTFIASLMLALAIAAFAAQWHHLWWYWFGTNDIGFFAQDRAAPCCLEGVIVSEPDRAPQPRTSKYDPIPRDETTRFTLRVDKLRDADNWVRASGQLECYVLGRIDKITRGNRVRIYGKLSSYPAPSNPGEFDYRAKARTERKLARLGVAFPEAVQVIEASSPPIPVLSQQRTSFDRLILNHVGPDRGPLASAILLGNREYLDRITQESFLVSGTIHILAISGLHVGILAGSIFLMGRLSWISRRVCLLITILFVIWYACLVEFRPPVVRATILITILCLANWSGRSAPSFNSLGAAALLIMLINPTQLFNIGAQLSFLAVATLSQSYPYFAPCPIPDPLDRLIARTRPRYQRFAKSIIERCRMALLATAVVWAVALPLVAMHFHVVAPIALIANPLIIPVLACALLSGFALMVTGLLFPSLSLLLGQLCNFSLSVLELIIGLSESFPGGHYWTAGPSAFSVAIFYIGLALFIVYPPTRLPKRWCWTLLLVWTVSLVISPGLLQSQRRSDSESLIATFISVGHGTSVLLQFPNGRTAIYDCGSFTSSQRAQQSTSGVLWDQGIKHIDLIMISHADLDHYNGLPELLKRFSVGKVIVPRVMADSPQVEQIRDLFAIMRRMGIPIEVVSLGDTIHIDELVKIEVLSPPPQGTGGSNNSDSMVISLSYGETSMLLPGDLEGPGLNCLLVSEASGFDVVMAPHHGSRRSNPERFIEWSEPSVWVVSSKPGSVNRQSMHKINERGIALRNTGDDNAVRVKLAARHVELQTWANGIWSDPHAVPLMR
ncbi:MAG TPA: DNA internalization-related competence protein ComEC/Rec2 [Pirellulaceae bacterium]|nr:DNA internalization-related competence protein ComEC/Rec2 [Pirellulaceae bacterium]HMO92972.1 DNA internalization-related competence protein ComEC/Rec2 [Pirellulaceae bacterium]HMP67950.1 DNA internalization-related competence protein ComEC/Rec2 [Pirellulaceae bacterium]